VQDVDATLGRQLQEMQAFDAVYQQVCPGLAGVHEWQLVVGPDQVCAGWPCCTAS
jgi:hypothetical protein